MSAATQGLCDAHIAMLGEVGSHGDGHTLAFKVALVEHLVDKCGFNAVLFEANQDEFLHLNERLRSGEAVTPDDLLTAVGGLWKFYREFLPLAPFLLQRAQARKVILGGFDDQLAQLGQNYANDEMITGFTSLLAPLDQQNCKAAFHKRIYYDFSDDKPYAKLDQSQLLSCLTKVNEAAHADLTLMGAARQDRQEMIAATQRWLSRDFTPDSVSATSRDRSMYQTFEWLQTRFALRNRKIIVWAATAHISKRGDPGWGDGSGVNFGSFIHHEYGKGARALGFSAVGGTSRQGKGKFPALPAAPTNSVEAIALQGTTASAVYMDAKGLATLGALPGAFFYHSYQTLAWSDFVDGVVVFRNEHPPSDTR